MSRREVTPEMLEEFRAMVRHKLLMWDACSRFEKLAELEIDTADLDDLCSCLGDAKDVDETVGEDELRDFLAGHDEEDGDDLCDKCMRSGVQVARTDEDGNTICVECDGDEE